MVVLKMVVVVMVAVKIMGMIKGFLFHAFYFMYFNTLHLFNDSYLAQNQAHCIIMWINLMTPPKVQDNNNPHL